MQGDILISTNQMVRGFALWERRFRDDPRAFTSDVERILKGETPRDYGKAAADYFRSLLVEAK